MANLASMDGVGPERCALLVMALCSASYPLPNKDDGFGHSNNIINIFVALSSLLNSLPALLYIQSSSTSSSVNICQSSLAHREQ